MDLQPPMPLTENSGGTAQDIVCISSIDWDFIWQGHQQVMSALAAQGHRVLFIENTGIRSVNFGDMKRLWKRLASWWRSVRGFRQEMPNLYIYSPLGLPFPYSRIAQKVNWFFITLDLRRWMKAVQFEKPVVWTFLPTPLAMDLIRSLDPKLVIYYCIDNFAASSPAASKVVRAEKRMLERADLVFVTSHQLKEQAERLNPNVHLFPFGVDFETFERARSAQAPAPDDIARIPHPRIGYVGGIHKWIDFDLIRKTAEKEKDLQFILVGPLQTDISMLRGLPNLHLLGHKNHAELPLYVKEFDVCLIPYRLTSYTDNVYPTKTNEYLAMGKPVVSTPLREIRLFNERCGGLVRTASSPEEFGRMVREALAEDGTETDRRLKTAKENSWETRIVRICSLIERTLQAEITGRELRWREGFLTLYRKAQRRVALTAAVVGIMAGLLFYSPLPWLFASGLKLSDPPRRADAIIVLAGGVGESGQAGQGYEERVQKALELYQSGYARKILFCSGYVFLFHETEMMKVLALSLGVPPEAILVESSAVNTRQNAVAVSKIAEDQGWKTVLLVSSPYHMRRARLAFHRAAPRLDLVMAPVENSYYYWKRRPGMTLAQMRGIFHEYAAILYYRWKGWV